MSLTTAMLRIMFARADKKRDASLTTPEDIERFTQACEVFRSIRQLLYKHTKDIDVREIKDKLSVEYRKGLSFL